MIKKEIIPVQKKGLKVQHSKSVTAESKNEAEALYWKAKQLLLDVNNWDKLSKAVPSYFNLTDNKGNLKNAGPETGDHVRIGLPVPSSVEGKEFDWVKIELLRYEEKNKENNIFMTLRPSPNPCREGNEIAHFYSKSSTSTFIIEQVNNIVVASYYGRNELPNVKDADRLFDKVRHVLVAVGGLIGLSKIQWKSFIKNIIDKSVKKNDHTI